jgi:hypothetical protein
MLFAQDLTNPVTTPSSPASTTADVAIAEGSNFFNTLFSFQIDFVQIVTVFQISVLAWSIFYTFQALIEFFEYRIFMNDGSLKLEGFGMQGMHRALSIWWYYIPVMVIFLTYIILRETQIAPVIGIFSILAGLIKMYLDMKKIINSVGYFDWTHGITNTVKRIFRMN